MDARLKVNSNCGCSSRVHGVSARQIGSATRAHDPRIKATLWVPDKRIRPTVTGAAAMDTEECPAELRSKAKTHAEAGCSRDGLCLDSWQCVRGTDGYYVRYTCKSCGGCGVGEFSKMEVPGGSPGGSGTGGLP